MMPPCRGNFDVRIGVEHIAQDSEGVIVCKRCGLTIMDRGGQLFPAIVAAKELKQISGLRYSEHWEPKRAGDSRPG